MIHALILAAALAADARAALSQTAEMQLDKGLHHLYSLEYPEARADFRKIIEAEPDNPFGYLFESGAIWWQSSMEYGLFKDTPTLQGLFEQDVEAALRKVDAYEASKDKVTRADGHFVEGMSLGTRGQWSIMRGHWLKAYFDGKKAIKHLKKAIKEDPSYMDAYLGIGVFDYQAAHFSGALKIGAALGGVHGDEKRGLQEIESAALKGRFGARQAAQFLASIYIDDKRDYARGLPLIQRLRGDFPESPYFEFIELGLRFKLHETAESVQLGRDLFDKVRGDPEAFDRKLMSLLCGISGDQCLNNEDAAGALAWIDAALEESKLHPAPKAKKVKPRPEDPEEAWRSFLHLWRGHCEDLLGNHADGEVDYKWVLAHPDFSDDRARAKECLDAGCPAGQLLEYLRVKSHGEPWPPAESAQTPSKR